jgi:hypothetical protein
MLFTAKCVRLALRNLISVEEREAARSANRHSSATGCRNATFGYIQLA